MLFWTADLWTLHWFQMSGWVQLTSSVVPVCSNWLRSEITKLATSLLLNKNLSKADLFTFDSFIGGGGDRAPKSRSRKFCWSNIFIGIKLWEKMFTNPSFNKHCFNLSPSFQFLVNKVFLLLPRRGSSVGRSSFKSCRVSEWGFESLCYINTPCCVIHEANMYCV